VGGGGGVTWIVGHGNGSAAQPQEAEEGGEDPKSPGV
jgi:hypothetical protein